MDLQYGDTSAERAAVERETGIRIERLDVDNTNDIDGLAALISACDLAVTVDNTTVHLAGALGKPGCWCRMGPPASGTGSRSGKRTARGIRAFTCGVSARRSRADLMSVVAAEVGQSIAAR